MNGINKIFYVLIGVVITVPISLVFSQGVSSLEYDQELIKQQTGEYFSDVSNPQFTINTYEKICRGYYTIEETEDMVIQTGYGDLADQYTLEYEKQKIQISTSTPTDVSSSTTDF